MMMMMKPNVHETERDCHSALHLAYLFDDVLLLLLLLLALHLRVEVTIRERRDVQALS
jgi:hypothetical protein